MNGFNSAMGLPKRDLFACGMLWIDQSRDMHYHVLKAHARVTSTSEQKVRLERLPTGDAQGNLPYSLFLTLLSAH